MFLQWIWTGGVVALWGIWGGLPGNNAWAAHSRQECSREGATGRMAEWQNGRSEVETLDAENGSGTYGWCLGGKELVNHGWMSHFTLYLLLSLSFQTMQALQDIKRLDSLEPRCQKLVIVESCLLELNQCRAMLARQIDKKISISTIIWIHISYIYIHIKYTNIYIYIYTYTYNIHIHICYMLKGIKTAQILGLSIGKALELRHQWSHRRRRKKRSLGPEFV